MVCTDRSVTRSVPPHFDPTLPSTPVSLSATYAYSPTDLLDRGHDWMN
eukprot:gene5919-5815_t